MYIPDECISFYNDNENDNITEFKDKEISIQLLLNVHYIYYVKTGKDKDGLQILYKILDKCAHHIGYNNKLYKMSEKLYKERKQQIDYAVECIKNNKISLIDAMMILFTIDDLECYGY
jgi:hypothetical protein